MTHSLACSVIGDQRQVEAGLASLIEQTQPDELMVTAQIYDHAARLRSFEITAQARAARWRAQGHASPHRADVNGCQADATNAARRTRIRMLDGYRFDKQ